MRVINETKDISPDAGKITDLFHQLYYYSRNKTWENTFWMGFPTLKCPLDMWVYQEIICELRPEVIIETGTFYGGSALFLAMLCDMVGQGEIITIDVEKRKPLPKHKRITYLIGSSTAPEIINQVKAIIGEKKNVLVILDSEHAKDHVLKELQLYHEFVPKGNYLIVEDSDVNGHPVRPDFGPGPMEAIEDFLEDNDTFVVDKGKEKFLMTQNPNGYLKRI